MTINLTEYQNENMDDLGCAPEDEYDIRLVKFMRDRDGDPILFGGEDKDWPYMRLLFEVIDHPDADGFNNFSEMLAIPAPNDDAKQRRKKLNKLRQYGEALDIDFFSNEIEPKDYEGNASCSAVLGVSDDEQWGEQNYIKQVLVRR